MSAVLTTHTGSLPRPETLKQLYLERSRGKPADLAEMEAQAAAAVRTMIRRQRDIGIDVINDGEQQRDQFFRYIQRRMTGFGGSWSRRVFADLAEYPAFKAMEERIIGNDVVSRSETGLAGLVGRWSGRLSHRLGGAALRMPALVAVPTPGNEAALRSMGRLRSQVLAAASLALVSLAGIAVVCWGPGSAHA